MTIGEIVESLGVQAGPEEDVILTSINKGGTVHNWRLGAVDEDNPDRYEALYLASGTFKKGTVEKNSGRKAENVARVLWLPFDCDLTEWSESTPQEIHEMSDRALEEVLSAQREDIETVFGYLGLPIHRLDVTGYGHCAYVVVDEPLGEDVVGCQKFQKLLISMMNDRIPGVVDPQVSDPGSRITRLPGSLNNKSENPKVVLTIYSCDRMPVSRTDLEAIIGVPPGATKPKQAEKLGSDLLSEIIEQIRPHWLDGQKHAMALAIAGYLAKAGVDEQSALSVVEVASFGDRKPWDRTAAVRDSYDKVARGVEVKGYTALKGMIPTETLEWLEERLAATRRAHKGPSLILTGAMPADADARLSDRFTSPPEDSYYGWFGEYRNLMAPTTEAPDAFHLGSSLTLAGAMISRHVGVRYVSGNVYPNLFTVLVGATGRSRKDTAISRAIGMSETYSSAQMKRPNFHVSHDISSSEGLVETLAEHPTTLIRISEMVALLQNAKRQSTSTILTRMMSAWDNPPALENNSKIKPVRADNPSLSILSAVQPSRLSAEITDNDIHSGFANRWLYITGAGKELMANPPEVDRIRAIQLYGELEASIASYPYGTMLSMDEDAITRWAAWYEHDDRDEDPDHLAMTQRRAVLIQKIALTFAVSDRATEIGDRHLSAAISLIDWSWGEVKMLMRTWGVSIKIEIEQRITTVLRAKGPMPKRTLHAQCSSRKWSGQEFASALKAMIEYGAIIMDDEKTQVAYVGHL